MIGTQAMSEATNEDKLLSEIIKISRIIELCFDLLSETKRNLIMQGTKNRKISDIYIESYHNNSPKFKPNLIHYAGAYGRNSYCENELDENTQLFFNELKEKIPNLSLPYRGTENSIYCYINLIKESVNQLKKKNHYTDALAKIISHFLYLDDFDVKINFRLHSFIGELFIDMGAIDNALKLYEIDQDFFCDPNILSILAHNAIKIGNPDWTAKLTDQLIKQEPYHPSISILQADIKRLEQRNRLKSTLSIDFSKIDRLSGVEFENLLQDKFAAMGFKVASTPTTGDFGADLIVENSEGSRIIVQCKRFKSKVNLKAVQEVVGAIGHYVGDYGVVITNNSFLNSAIKLAESHDIELWDGDKLVSFLAGDLSFSEIIGTTL